MSGFLLDTNIPSELIRSQPNPRVEQWVFAQDECSLFLSAVTIGELRKGFVILPSLSTRCARTDGGRASRCRPFNPGIRLQGQGRAAIHRCGQRNGRS